MYRVAFSGGDEGRREGRRALSSETRKWLSQICLCQSQASKLLAKRLIKWGKEKKTREQEAEKKGRRNTGERDEN